MKNIYKKFLILFCFLVSFLAVGCTRQTEDVDVVKSSLTDCRDDMDCAEKVSGIKFPLVLSNFRVSAISDLIEITYPLDEFKDVTIRKTTLNADNKLDIDKDYSNYADFGVLSLENGVDVKVRRSNDVIYVAYLTADSGYYSMYSPKGLSEKEIWQIYNLLAEVEAH